MFDPVSGTEHVGESMTRRGEDVAKEEHEPGRHSTGTDGTPANRPTGESTGRDVTGVNADEDLAGRGAGGRLVLAAWNV